MTTEATISLVVVIPLITCGIAIFTFKRSIEKDIEKRAEERGKSNAQLDSIATDTREIVIDIRSMQNRMSEHTKEIAIVSESVKSAHHRIDELKKER